jgi:CRP-like cAMP-binding protein
MMSPEELKQARFFQDVPEDHLKRIAEIADIQIVPSGTVIFREGDTSSFVYIVHEGRVSLEIRVPGRGPVQVQTVGAGELLGWSPVLEAGPMTATARSTSPSRLIALHVPQLLAVCKHDPPLAAELMHRTAMALAQRLKATRLQLLDIYRLEMPAIPVPAHAGEGGPS